MIYVSTAQLVFGNALLTMPVLATCIFANSGVPVEVAARVTALPYQHRAIKLPASSDWTLPK
jgi:hypothetical protein